MYQLLPGQDNKLRYVSEIRQTGRDDIWIVNIISDEHISISSLQSPATKYFLLKRVKLDPNMRAEDGKRAFEAWKVWAQAMAPILAPKTTFTWKEEVLLHDGKTIIVERSDTYDPTMNHEIGQGAPLAEHKTTFMILGTNQTVIWKSNNRPSPGPDSFYLLALDFLDGVPYVATRSASCVAYNKWKRPNPPYVFFKYADGWKNISLEDFPEKFKINVIVTGRKMDSPKISEADKKFGFVPAQTVAAINREPGASKEFYTLFREPIDLFGRCPEYGGGSKAPFPITPPNTMEEKK